MGTEIERKFLLKTGAAWRPVLQTPGTLIRQGYLSLAKERTVRVRVSGEESACLTIKGLTIGATRSEFEYDIPHEDALAMLAMCEGSLIEKTRYHIVHDGLTFEIDEFHGDNEGLLVAEVELESEGQTFAVPEWLGSEVTNDPRYFNANLVRHPFREW